MTYSAQQILNFLSQHYVALRQLYTWAQAQHHSITAAQLEELCTREGIRKQLFNYKILQEDSTGHYYLHERYFQFLAFLHRDFSLDLPEQLAKYRDALAQLTERLVATPASEGGRVEEVAGNLVGELHRFLAHLEDNTTALEEAVDKLRTTQTGQEGYAVRIGRATYLIETFLKPLNLILAPHEEAIVQVLRRLQAHAHAQALALPDTYRGGAYRLLLTHVALAQQHLEEHLARLIRNLLPLLEHMRKSDQVLAGLKYLRDAHTERAYDRYLPYLPVLIKRSQSHPYNAYREGDAEAIVAEAGAARAVVLFASSAPAKRWVILPSTYREALSQALAHAPVVDFFGWCYDALKANEPEMPLTIAPFFQVVNLIFDTYLHRTATGARTTLHFDDGMLTVPTLHVTTL